ncbi:hypothetical protein [Streptomyces sp. NPDC101237]|uniref:hypothetical protein n=1 Tax=Streptomyces sp. NPDC101237 TaxID=3366139 RepID=UPI0038218DA8
MSTNRDIVVAARTIPDTVGNTSTAETNVTNPVPLPARITLAHTLPITVFPVCGVALSLAGHLPTGQILELLSGCGAIGAGAVAVITGGRHLGAAAGRAARAAFDKNAG